MRWYRGEKLKEMILQGIRISQTTQSEAKKLFQAKLTKYYNLRIGPIENVTSIPTKCCKLF